MKKYILTLSVLSLSVLSVCAQKPFPKEHLIGVTGGMNMSKMTCRPSIVQDYKMGETFGISYRYIEEKFFGIQAELLFTTRGWKDRLEDYPDLYFDRTLSYIELPIMSHIFFGNNRFRGFVNLGPQISYFTGSDKINVNFDSSFSDEIITSHHYLSVANRFDYGIVGGAGIELRFGRNIVAIEGRYYFGLGDIFPNEKKDEFEASSHQNISIKATYYFRLGK